MPDDKVRPDQVETEASKKTDEVKPVEDNVGLGLGGFLTTPSPDEDKSSTDGEDKAKASKEDAKGDEEGKDAGAKKEDKEPDKEPDETPKVEPEGAKKKEDTPSPDAAKEEPKKDVKPEVKKDEPKKEDPSVKRLRDTQSYATDLNKKVLEQDRQIMILNKKIEGTYDEDKDEPKATLEQIEEDAAVKGRAIASHEAAISQFGEEKVAEDLQKFNDIFAGDTHVQASVRAKSQPVMEAIKLVRRHEFFEEFGQVPAEIVEKIRTKVRAEETEKIREEEAAKLAARVKGKKEEATGLAGLSSKGGVTESTEKAPGPAPLKTMFPN